jgi:hypothetical protein
MIEYFLSPAPELRIVQLERLLRAAKHELPDAQTADIGQTYTWLAAPDWVTQYCAEVNHDQ